MNGETSKIRNKVEKYTQGFGLDVGCGDDKINDSAIGLDMRGLPCVTICRELEDLSLFGDNQFDFVFSSHFLEHIDMPKRMMLEMDRVLKMGGYLILYLPDPKKYTEDNPEHKTLWTPKQFNKIIMSNTYKIKKVKMSTAFDYSYLYIGQKR